MIGGGIAGLTTAIALYKASFKTQIFESAPEIKAVGAGLGLGANAIAAFDRLGLKYEVVERGRALPSFSIYDQKKKLITRTDSPGWRKFVSPDARQTRANRDNIYIERLWFDVEFQ